MIADPDLMPGDEPEELMRNEIIYLVARCRKLDAACREAQIAAWMWEVIAVCEAGLIVALLMMALWRGAT